MSRTSSWDLGGMTMRRKSVIFLGDSIMQWMPIEMQDTFLNLSVSGETTETLLNRVKQLNHLNPEKIFLMVGVNDLAFRFKMKQIVSNYEKILDELIRLVSNENVFCISLLPSDEHIVENEKICFMNRRIKCICESFKVKYMDIYSKFLDEENNIDDSYKFDLFTMNEKGYRLLNRSIKKNL